MNAKTAIGLITALFVLPIIGSWLYVHSGFNWLQQDLSNRGILIRPAIDLRDIESVQTIFQFAQLQPSEWALISLEPDVCADDCAARLQKISVIKSVMGSSQERLRTFALAAVSQNPAEKDEVLVDNEALEDLSRLLQISDSDANLPQFVVVDWRRQLMLRFSPDAPSIDIKKDLKKLLRASKIR